MSKHRRKLNQRQIVEMADQLVELLTCFKTIAIAYLTSGNDLVIVMNFSGRNRVKPIHIYEIYSILKEMEAIRSHFIKNSLIIS